MPVSTDTAYVHKAWHEVVVCPASWTPGKDVLKSNIDLIGKI